MITALIITLIVVATTVIIMADHRRRVRRTIKPTKIFYHPAYISESEIRKLLDRQ